MRDRGDHRGPERTGIRVRSRAMHHTEGIRAELRPGSAARSAADQEHVGRSELHRAQPIDHVTRGEHESLEHGPRDVRLPMRGAETVQGAARVRSPHRRHRARERGEERDTIRTGGDARCEEIEFAIVGDAEELARPAHGATGKPPRMLDQVREKGDWERWLAFFLEGVSVAALHAERNIVTIASLLAADRRKLLASPKAGPASYRLFEMLPMMPRFNIEQVRQKLGTSFPTANAAVKVLEDLGIVTEQTGQKKNRSYSYSAYIASLSS